MSKYVYGFGAGWADGKADQKERLGGKGANLAEMCLLGIPVPAGFTITTGACVEYFTAGMTFPAGLEAEVNAALAKIETEMKMPFGAAANPLLVSCRSGARQSMPGMMETVLNVGLTTKTIPGLIKQTGDERFAIEIHQMNPVKDARQSPQIQVVAVSGPQDAQLARRPKVALQQ